MWTVWFGKGLSPAVLIPTAIFFTYKANNDSTVFNFDIWKRTIMKLLGLRLKRSVMGKEVIITDPDYRKDRESLAGISEEIVAYSRAHKLKSPPNVVNVFFRYQPDNEILRLSEVLETIIEDLANTRDKHIISALNKYPIVSVKAHTRPFERKWLNILAAVVVPVGAFLYLRMWRFRLRLYRDLIVIRDTNTEIMSRIDAVHQ